MKKKFKIEKIFVGREKELENLQTFWEWSQDNDENRVYAVLNAPGVGKTTLLKYFGNKLMNEKNGVMVEIRSSIKENKINRYLSHTLEAILKSIGENRETIEDYISLQFKETETTNGAESVTKGQKINKKYLFKTKEEAIDELNDLEDTLKPIIKQFNEIDNNLNPDPEYLANLPDVFPRKLKNLSKIIPVFLFIDEIQVLQSISYVNDKKENESFLHLCSAELADLLNTKVLIAVSGTQYRLMKEIGFGVGSPLRDKVEHFVIHPLGRNNLINYHQIVSDYFSEQVINLDLNLAPEINNLLPWYKGLIMGYSGGHARTLEKLTKAFLNNLEIKNKKAIPISYEEFLDRYINLSETKKYYPNLTSKIKENIIELQKIEDFNLIHDWILNLSLFGQSLQRRPEEKELNENTEFIANELVQMGILMINGESNYYITSYFHLLGYLNAIHDDYSVFLNEILTNKYFKLMCGYHSGLGYVFEEILLATIMQLKGTNMKLNETTSDITLEIIPFNPSKTYSVIKLPSSVDYTSQIIENNVIYHTPLKAGVDFIIRDDDKIILIQVTTMKSVDTDKICSMDKIYSALYKNPNKKCNIIKWFISLSPISEKIIKTVSEDTKRNLIITAGDELKKIVGKEMYERLNYVKEEFRTFF
jgi:hypothetical protein